MSETERMSSFMGSIRPSSAAQWVIAIALSVIAIGTIWPRSTLDQTLAQNNSLVGSHGIHAFTGQLDKDRYGLFMMDVDASTVWVYEYLPLKRSIKLVAARSFTYDRYLENYNCEEPTPEMIQQILRKQRQQGQTPPIPPVGASGS